MNLPAGNNSICVLHDTATIQAARRCVAIYDTLIAPECNTDDATDTILNCFFGSGLTELEVIEIFCNVRRSLDQEPEDWELADGQLPDIQWISEVWDLPGLAPRRWRVRAMRDERADTNYVVSEIVN